MCIFPYFALYLSQVSSMLRSTFPFSILLVNPANFPTGMGIWEKFEVANHFFCTSFPQYDDSRYTFYVTRSKTISRLENDPAGSEHKLVSLKYPSLCQGTRRLQVLLIFSKQLHLRMYFSCFTNIDKNCL